MIWWMWLGIFPQEARIRKEARKIVNYRVSIQLADWLDWLIINEEQGHGFWGFVFPITFPPFRFQFLTIRLICLGALKAPAFGIRRFEVLLEREEHRRALQAANCSGHPERMDQADGTSRWCNTHLEGSKISQECWLTVSYFYSNGIKYCLCLRILIFHT